LNIVTLENGDKYAVDCSFGGESPTSPLQLVERQPVVNLGTQEIQLIQESVPVFTSGQKMWQYQVRHSKERDWNTFYCFSEVEFIHEDFEVMNWYTCKNPNSFHSDGIFVVKLFGDGEKVYKKMIMVDGTVKENSPETGGRTKVKLLCQTEEERLAAFKEYFSIEFTDEEKTAIHGTCTELIAGKAPKYS
jgi:arylamine N-acetyltransferase